MYINQLLSVKNEITTKDVETLCAIKEKTNGSLQSEGDATRGPGRSPWSEETSTRPRLWRATTSLDRLG